MIFTLVSLETIIRVVNLLIKAVEHYERWMPGCLKIEIRPTLLVAVREETTDLFPGEAARLQVKEEADNRHACF